MPSFKQIMGVITMGVLYGFSQLVMAIEPADPAASTSQNSPTTETIPAAAPQPAPVIADEQSGFSRGSVVRSVFTSAIDQREPVDKLKQVEKEQSKVFYFTELRDMTGQTAKHRWQYNGKVVAEVDFNVQGPRWRVWSTKSFSPTAAGEWKVSVLNGAGEIIAEELLSVADASTDASNNSQQPSMPDEAQPAKPEAPANMQ